MYKPSLESENLNVFKNRADLAPLPQPDIQPNTINLAQNFPLQFGFTTKIYSADSWEHW